MTNPQWVILGLASLLHTLFNYKKLNAMNFGVLPILVVAFNIWMFLSGINAQNFPEFIIESSKMVILSAVFLAIHSIFLGIKFDIQIYKLLRRVVLLLFIIFEIIAQGILVYHFFKIKNILTQLISKKILILKIVLVSILTTVGILSLPILLNKDNTHFKHALEWNFFVGVILFYLFSRFFWKRTT